MLVPLDDASDSMLRKLRSSWTVLTCLPIFVNQEPALFFFYIYFTFPSQPIGTVSAALSIPAELIRDACLGFCSLLQQLIVASGPGAEEDMTGLLELLHATSHTHLSLRDSSKDSHQCTNILFSLQ
jgi:hypothetical protein